MVVCYPSSVNPLIKYYDSDDVQKLSSSHYENGWKKVACGGFGGNFLLCSPDLSESEELEYLVKLWNDVPEIVSSDVLYRMSCLARQLKLKIKVSLKS